MCWVTSSAAHAARPLPRPRPGGQVHKSTHSAGCPPAQNHPQTPNPQPNSDFPGTSQQRGRRSNEWIGVHGFHGPPARSLPSASDGAGTKRCGPRSLSKRGGKGREGRGVAAACLGTLDPTWDTVRRTKVAVITPYRTHTIPVFALRTNLPLSTLSSDDGRDYVVKPPSATSCARLIISSSRKVLVSRPEDERPCRRAPLGLLGCTSCCRCSNTDARSGSQKKCVFFPLCIVLRDESGCDVQAAVGAAAWVASLICWGLDPRELCFSASWTPTTQRHTAQLVCKLRCAARATNQTRSAGQLAPASSGVSKDGYSSYRHQVWKCLRLLLAPPHADIQLQPK